MSRVTTGAVFGAALTVLSACGADDASGSLENAETKGSLANASGASVLPDVPGAKKLDLLLMIDNSGSMANKQARLLAQVPRMLSVLTSGDRCAALPADETCTFADAARYFTPVESLHVGVVSSNLGGLDNPPLQQPAIAACAGNGDDGELQHALDIAIQGVTAQQRGEFSGNTQVGDVIVSPSPVCSTFGAAPLYQAYSSAVDNLASVQTELSCVERLGVRGCPFEQQLEAPWKALAPSQGKGANYVFLNGTHGQGDTFNAGFLRDDALLGIVLLTDEDDCSITDAGKALITVPGQPGYDDANAKYGALNLRCGFNSTNPDLVQPVQRYIDGYRSLKPGHPERVLMLAITGVPQAAVAAGSTPAEILALPVMQFTENPAMIGYPNVSCLNETTLENAYPPIRIVQVVQGLGAQGVVASICEDTYRPAVATFVDKVATQLDALGVP